MNKGWLELESDPGLFTLLLEDFGVDGVQVEEIYDLQKPIEGTVYGFIFLFRWIEERRSRRKTNSEVESFVTDADAVNKIFFAQQIIPNSCATHALLSVLLNCGSKVKLGKTLNLIKDFTDSMSPEDKGYAIANMPELARVHNSYARPETSKPVPEKQAGLSSVRAMDSETFHFVSYVPIHGHLFELDGLKPHPIDHGPWEKGDDWTEKFRRVISDRLGMATGGEPYHDIRFNLMAVVPDKRQLLEHKLMTLKTNRNIVLEALQQVVSPTSSEKSDSEGTSSVKESKKCVTFSTDIPHTSDKITPDVPCPVSSSAPDAGTSGTSAPASSQPCSILKGGSSSTSTTNVTASTQDHTTSSSEKAGPASSNLPGAGETVVSNLSSDTVTQGKTETPATTSTTNSVPGVKDVNTTSHGAVCESKKSTDTVNLCEESGSEGKQKIEVKIEPDAAVEQMDTSGTPKESASSSDKPVVKVEGIKSSESKVFLHASSVSGTLRADITKPLSIETKFSTSPCAASNESTDTASEIGSGFSSPGSLNTSSSQSSPQFSDGNTGTKGCDDRHRRKRRSSHAFTPKDLLYLLKNVENEIELCETSLKEENEKRKKYKIDACRRTHNYDQFIMTFLSMLAEQGLLGELMEENMAIKKPGGTSATGANNSTAGSKIGKKPQFNVANKKKKSPKIKKKGKR
ncbi:ubiquitin carboxyl-terminal hydrolase [Plakobranchus ocellatus]|uniref:Ubiquitin carboxyl-terminal hydrolase n=1 Tax=Plakobranchus ocellatus TaxID=259542 RepID=A0AAV4BV50_9GAST|nr:ubiquitin carboxyl-terminal hydrolase [Plakobranchus ocellatus]